jgi:hypothetical protein
MYCRVFGHQVWKEMKFSLNFLKLKVTVTFGVLTVVAMKSFYLLGDNASESQSEFQRKISSPFSGSKSKLTKKPACSRQQADLCWFFASILKTEAILVSPSETSVDIHLATHSYIADELKVTLTCLMVYRCLHSNFIGF